MYGFFYLIFAAVAILVVLCDNLENLNIERDVKLSPVNIYSVERCVFVM